MANIVGGVTSINNPRTNWAQTDKTKADFLKNKPSVANALKGTESGEIVLMTDISPTEHEMAVKVTSKNLIPFPYTDSTIERDGISITVNDDGGIAISGNPSSASFFIVADSDSGINLEHGATYTLSGGIFTYTNPIGESETEYTYLRYQKPNGSIGAIKSGESLVWDNGYKLIDIGFNIWAEGCTYDTIVSAPQLEKGAIATAYTPYIPDISAVKVKKCGKNLYNLGSTLTQTGGTNPQKTLEILAGNTYTVSAILADDPQGVKGRLKLVYTADGEDVYVNGAYVQQGERAKVSAHIPVGATNIRVLFQKNSQSGSMTWENIQVEIGDTATDYEPYIEPVEYSVSADGTVEGVISIHPTTTLITDTEGAVIDCTYNRDTNKAITDLEAKLNALIATIVG